MKIKIVAMILLIIFLLSSCTPVDTTPPQKSDTVEEGDATENGSDTTPITSAEDELPATEDFIPATIGQLFWRGHDIIVTSEGYIVDIHTGEKTSICFDPICEQGGHSSSTCPAAVLSRGMYFVISPEESKDSLVIYLDTRSSFIRYDQATQTIDVLAQGLDLIGTTWRFDPYTNTIYYMAYRAESPTQMSLYALDTKEKEVRCLADTPDQVFVSCIVDNMMYMYNKRTVYSLDLNDEDAKCTEIYQVEPSYLVKRIKGGYVYYYLRERQYYTVPQEILDYHDATFDPSAAEYQTWNDTVYRIPLQDLSAEPELIMEDVSYIGVQDGLLFYIKHAPQSAFSYVTYQGKNYAWDDPAAPPKGTLKHVFTWDSGEGGIIDLTTMEEIVTFRLDGYCLTPYVAWDFDGTGFMYGEVIDSHEAVFIEEGYSSLPTVYVNIPLRQGVVTDEDMIIMEPN